jgi:hypothetical protein
MSFKSAPSGNAIEEARVAIESFLAGARQPALFEPGEELLAITPDNFCEIGRAHV